MITKYALYNTATKRFHRSGRNGPQLYVKGNATATLNVKRRQHDNSREYWLSDAGAELVARYGENSYYGRRRQAAQASVATPFPWVLIPAHILIDTSDYD